MKGNMAIQLVWDMDGTLLDSTTVVPDAFIAAVHELSGNTIDRNDVIDSYSRGVPEKILEHFLRRSLRPGEEDAYYCRLLGAHPLPYDGVAETLDQLRAVNHPLVVFTGASTRAAKVLLQSAGIEVDVLIGGELVDNPKPAPDGLQLAATTCGLGPSNLVYIGDAPTDVRAARAAGAHAAAAAWGHLYQPSKLADITLAHPQDALELISGYTLRSRG